MSGRFRNVLVTGAAGFIGSRLVQALLGDARFDQARFTLLDIAAPDVDDERARCIAGDLCDPSLLGELAGNADLVFHLAAVLGGAAETDYPLSRRVNVEATLSLFEALRDAGKVPRVVYASSIAVFGPPLPARVDDDTIPHPVMVYGAQKLMMETALAQFSARGWIDGIAIRLPGIVARADADARLKSAFLNQVFYAVANGEDYVLPVSPDGTTWLISVPACVNAFIHAAAVPADQLDQRRAFTLPAQQVRIGALVEALHRCFPDSRSNISYQPDPTIEAQFASQPPLATPCADRLGFVHDGSIDRLVERAVETQTR